MADRIERVAGEAVEAILALRAESRQAGWSEPETVYEQVRRSLDEVTAAARREGFAQEEASDILYALTALADETALRASAGLADHWTTRLLQVHYFGSANAGDGFFDKLESYRGRTGSVEVLRTFYLCLLLGFRGRYAVHGGEVELEDYIAGVRRALARAGLDDPETLSPHGERPREALARPARQWPLFWAPIAAAGGALALYVAMSGLVSAKASSLTDLVQSLLSKT